MMSRSHSYHARACQIIRFASMQSSSRYIDELFVSMQDIHRLAWFVALQMIVTGQICLPSSMKKKNYLFAKAQVTWAM